MKKLIVLIFLLTSFNAISQKNKHLTYSIKSSKNLTLKKENLFSKEYKGLDKVISLLNKKHNYSPIWMELNYSFEETFKNYVFKNTTNELLLLRHTKSIKGGFSPEHILTKEIYRFDNIHTGTDKRIDLKVQSIKDKCFLLEQSFYCHDVFFDDENPYLETIKYGCCSVPSVIRKYDFKGVQVAETYNSFLKLHLENKTDSTIEVGLNRNQSSNKELVLSFSVYKNSSLTRKHQYIIINHPSKSVSVSDNYTDKPIFKVNINNESYQQLDYLRINSIDKINISIPIDYNSSTTPLIIPIINGKPFGKDDEEIILTIK